MKQEHVGENSAQQQQALKNEEQLQESSGEERRGRKQPERWKRQKVKRQKFYVVWQGVVPGIYTSWPECAAQVTGVGGARFKSFPTREQAEAAYRDLPDNYIGASEGKPMWRIKGALKSPSFGKRRGQRFTFN